jgi:SnoaL-like protein
VTTVHLLAPKGASLTSSEGGTEMMEPAETSSQDRAALVDLMVAWAAHRDAGRWDDLAGLFTPDATVELTWTRATAAEFVAAARGHASGPLRSKHVVAAPHAVVRGDRAAAETNVVLVTDHLDLDLGAVTHARFLDRLERVDSGWVIAHRASVYDACGFTFPFGPVEVDQKVARNFPREYAGLAYQLVSAGYDPSPKSPTRGSAREHAIRNDQRAWLCERNR